MNKGLKSLALITLATTLIAFGNGAAQVANVKCGDEIFADTKLKANVDCFLFPGADGIMIGAPGVTLNLNGFNIEGDPAPEASGVFNPGFDDVTIKNGAISGFQDGVRADGVNDLDIKDVSFNGQRLSSIVIINSATVKIKGVFISQPPMGGGGFAEAIRLFNVVDAKVTNAIVDGGVFGLLSLGDPGVPTELVVKNNVFNNTTDGIHFENTTDSKIIGNRVLDAGRTGIGLFVGSVGNQIKTNNVTGSADDDLFHDETSSPNRWINNTCGSSGGDDIDCP